MMTSIYNRGLSEAKSNNYNAEKPWIYQNDNNKREINNYENVCYIQPYSLLPRWPKSPSEARQTAQCHNTKGLQGGSNSTTGNLAVTADALKSTIYNSVTASVAKWIEQYCRSSLFANGWEPKIYCNGLFKIIQLVLQIPQWVHPHLILI
jgi:hypothetical protein